MEDEKTIPLSKARIGLMRANIGKLFDNELVLTKRDAEQLLDAVERKLDQDEVIKWFGRWLDSASLYTRGDSTKLGDVIGAWDTAREQKAK